MRSLQPSIGLALAVLFALPGVLGLAVLARSTATLPFAETSTTRRGVGANLFGLSSLVGEQPTPLPARAEGAPGRQEDEQAHPYVGIMVARVEGSLTAICSGTLIAPATFVTAGHCTAHALDHALPVYVSFAPAFLPAASDSGWRLRPARTVLTNRSYLHSATDAPTGDLGLVLLAEPVTTVAPALLPPEGLLDRLGAFSGDATGEYPWQSLITVGYGISMSNHSGSAQATSLAFPASLPNTRRWRASYAALPFDRVFPDSLHIRRADGAATRYRAGGPLSDGSGPTPSDSTVTACAGGSGGPVLLGNTSTIVAVTSFGPGRYATCTGADGAYRLDTPAARAFLDGFVPLP